MSLLCEFGFALSWNKIRVLLALTGLLVAGLGANVYGQSPTESESKTVYFVLLDTSVSMSKRPENPAAISWICKIDEVKRQMATFITSLPDDTEVRLYSFDKECVVGPSIDVLSTGERKKLVEFVNSLQATGRETRLWRSLDSVLGEASVVAEKRPGVCVRVLAYSDGEDTETPVSTKPSAVLAKYRQLLKQSQVQLTYVTIGFELQADLRKSLESDGVQVRKAVVPEDIIPLMAECRVVPSELLVGAAVTVLDDSTGIIRGRTVDWGDGSESTRGRSPTHVYKEAGEYSVRLTITSASGQESTAARRVRVTLPPEPLAHFKLSAAEIKAGESVLMVNESMGVECQYKWSFGDGRTSTERHPQVKYLLAGEFAVRLTVTDSYRRVKETECTLKVNGPKAPIAAIIGPERVDLNTPVQFLDRSSGEITSRMWFVDGHEVSSSQDCDLTFSEPGLHQVRLALKGPGGTAVAEQKIEVLRPESPKAAIAGPETADVKQTVKFFNRSTGHIDEYAWLVDGQRTTDTPDLAHAFVEPGKHTLVLSVKGPGGQSTVEHEIEVRGPAAPIAAFHIPEVADSDELVELIDQSSGLIESRTWTVDGTVVSHDRDTAYRFSSMGDHVVQLEVCGPGGSVMMERTIRVMPTPAPTAKIVIGTPEPRVGEAVVLTDTSDGEIDTAKWYLPAREGPLVVDYRTGAARSIEQTFEEPGEVEIRLVVCGRGGEHETTSRIRITSRYAPPVGLVMVDQSHGRGSLLVEFRNRSSGSIQQTEYDFGDGSALRSVAGLESVRHQYGPGSYLARVRLLGSKEFAPAIVEIPIEVARPFPAWIWHLWWRIPGGLSLLVGSVSGWWFWRRRREERRLSMLVGTLNYKLRKDPVAPYLSVQFAGSAQEERVPLNETTHAVVRATTDPVTHVVEHSIEVVDGSGRQDGPAPLPENDRITVGEFEFNLVQA